MPMLDAYIPEGALEASAERELIEKLTDILLKWEGADPKDPAARAIAWVFLHRPTQTFVGGEPAETPRYRIVASVPEGQLDAERRQGMVDAVTNAVLDAEPPGRQRDPFRVWVFTSQVPEGTWGAGGNVVGLADIVGYILNDPEAATAHAKRRLAIVKSERDAIFA